MEKMKKNGGGAKGIDVVREESTTFVNLTYDPGFKIVFGTEGKSERLLMTLINSILGMRIVSVKYLPTERLGLTEEESSSFFDVYCEDSSGRRILIEMQMWSQHYFHKRAVYYSSMSVRDQSFIEKKYQKEKLGRRNWNYYFAPVYVVSFLNFPNTIVDTKDEGGNPYISHYVYRSRDTGRELGDETNIIFIDLEKFRKDFEDCKDECERWLYSIRNMHRLKKRPDGIEGTELEELYNEAYYAAWPAEKRTLYEKNIMNRNDYGNILEERYEDGLAAGLAEGVARGREEGRAEGRAEGGQTKALEIAINLKRTGIANDVIAKATGLTEEQVEAL